MVQLQFSLKNTEILTNFSEMLLLILLHFCLVCKPSKILIKTLLRGTKLVSIDVNYKYLVNGNFLVKALLPSFSLPLS